MTRKAFKRIARTQKLKYFLEKNNISSEYLSVNRRMVSKAVLVGLFIAFIPMPMQMLAVIFTIPFIKFNVPIALAMCWITNPLTMPFIYYLEYKLGSLVLNIKMMPLEMTINWFNLNIGNIFIPLYTGAFIFSISISILAYYLLHYLWKTSVHKNKQMHFSKRI